MILMCVLTVEEHSYAKPSFPPAFGAPVSINKTNQVLLQHLRPKGSKYRTTPNGLIFTSPSVHLLLHISASLCNEILHLSCEAGYAGWSGDSKEQGMFLHGAHCIQKFHLLHIAGGVVEIHTLWYSTSADFKQIRCCVTFCIYSYHCIYYTVLQGSLSLYVSLIRQ